MKTTFRRSFERDLRKLKDAAVRRRVVEVIADVEAADTPSQIQDLRVVRGANNCYRIRLGEYRIGVVIDGETVRFVRCLHRREIYRYFP